MATTSLDLVFGQRLDGLARRIPAMDDRSFLAPAPKRRQRRRI